MLSFEAAFNHRLSQYNKVPVLRVIDPVNLSTYGWWGSFVTDGDTERGFLSVIKTMNINKCIDTSFSGNWRELTVDIHDTIVDINFGKMVVVSNKREEGADGKPVWYVTVISRSDPGSLQSSIPLTVSLPWPGESAFLTTAHSEKVRGEKGQKREGIQGRNVHLTVSPLHQYSSLLTHSYLSPHPSPLVFHLTPLCPHLNPLTTWHELDPHSGHLHRSSIPLHTRPCYGLKLIVLSTGHAPFV